MGGLEGGQAGEQPPGGGLELMQGVGFETEDRRHPLDQLGRARSRVLSCADIGKRRARGHPDRSRAGSGSSGRLIVVIPTEPMIHDRRDGEDEDAGRHQPVAVEEIAHRRRAGRGAGRAAGR